MESRDIEYFAVIAAHGNLRRASEALNLSPPALSKSLRRLEASLAAKLCERNARGVSLTPVGRALLAHVQPLRNALGDIRREAADLSAGRSGHLRIGAGATTVEDLAEHFAALLRDTPDLSAQVTVADNDVMVPALCRGDLDLLFNVLPESSYPGCEQERVFDDVFVVCAAAGHRLARRRRVTIADLREEQWTLSAPGVLNVQFVQQVFAAAGLPAPRIAVEARPLRLRLQLCASSNLLAFSARRTLPLVPGLVELPVEQLRWPRAIGVIYRRESYLSPAARRFIRLLQAPA